MTEPTVRFYAMPAEGPITGRFGDRYSDGPKTWLHRGVDVGCPTGTPVRAPAAGMVAQPFNDGTFGTAVCLDHGDGWYTLYAHLSRSDVALGQRCPKGLQLGLSGATGYVSGAHLHWQLSDSPTFPVDISHSRDPLHYLITTEDQPMTPAERGLLNIAWGDFQRALDCYRALRDPNVTPQNIRDLLPNEGIETALANGDPADDLNAAMILRGRLTTMATSDVANDAYAILGGTP